MAQVAIEDKRFFQDAVLAKALDVAYKAETAAQERRAVTTAAPRRPQVRSGIVSGEALAAHPRP